MPDLPEFDLQIAQAGGGFSVELRAAYRARELPPQPLALPFELASLPQARRSVADWVKQARITRLRGSPEQRLARTFGGALFRALFNAEILAAFRASRAALEAGERLFVHLRLPPALIALPWELLYDERDEQFLTLAPDVTLARYVDAPRRDAPLAVSGPLQVVAVLASPATSDYPPINLDRELRRIAAAIKQPIEQGRIALDVIRGPATLDQLRDRLRRPVHVLHVLCHGDLSTQSGEGVLIFEDGDGAPEPVSAELLRQQIQKQRGQTQLVLLNACLGALPVGNDPFSSVGAALMGGGVAAVIAMQFEIAEDAATELARVFYAELAAGEPLDAALTAARLHLFGRFPNQLDWAIPVLFLRADTDAVFEIAPADPAALPTLATPPRPVPPGGAAGGESSRRPMPPPLLWGAPGGVALVALVALVIAGLMGLFTGRTPEDQWPAGTPVASLTSSPAVASAPATAEPTLPAAPSGPLPVSLEEFAALQATSEALQATIAALTAPTATAMAAMVGDEPPAATAPALPPTPAPAQLSQTDYPTSGTPPMIGKMLTIAEWLDYVGSYQFGELLPDRVVLKHTFVPNEENWEGRSSMEGMQRYYAGKGWAADSHVYAAPDGIWLFTPMKDIGIGAATGSGSVREGWYSIQIFMVGDFDRQRPTGAVWENTKAVIGGLSLRLGIPPRDLITFQRDYTESKSSPGWAVEKEWVIAEVEQWIAERSGEPPAPAGRITFVTRAGEQSPYQISTARADGSGEICLTCESDSLLGAGSNRVQPAWSPDGRQLAFTWSAAGREDIQDVFVAQLDPRRRLTSARRLTGSVRGSLSAPAWSPDGRSIVFAALREGRSRLIVMAADGSGAPVELAAGDAPVEGRSPAWSPLGGQIAFVRDAAGESDIYVIEIDDGLSVLGERRLTNSSARDDGPAWSPDGGTIAFYSKRNGNWDVFVMDADGDDQRALTTGSGNEYHPVWSPDGRYLAYFAGSARGDIYLMDAGGGNQRPLTRRGDVVDSRMAWGQP